MHILAITAHPDDPEVHCGGTCLQWVDQGHEVVWLTCTTGDTGHHQIGGIQLARRRFAEAQAAARVGGIHEYRILDNHTGELEATVANRRTIIRIMREVDPDLVLTHRPNDYHPDHRYTSQLVMDASFIVTVPNMVALTDVPSRAPPIYYLYDKFRRPYPFAADAVVAIDDEIDRKFQMLDCHESQMYEWVPFNQGVLDQVPADRGRRLEWLRGRRLPLFAHIADTFRDKLIQRYGEKRGAAVKYAEAFEACEYGGAPDQQILRRLFPN